VVTRRAAWLLVFGRFLQLKTEVVEHVAGCALAALDSAVEVALTERGGMFTSKVDAILGCAEKPPIARELTGAEDGSDSWTARAKR